MQPPSQASATRTTSCPGNPATNLRLQPRPPLPIHHRLKTHGRWRYLALKPGMFLWTSPHGYHYLVDHHGTTDVSTDRSRHGHRATNATNDPAPPDQ